MISPPPSSSSDSGAATLSGSGTAYTLEFGRRTIGETLPSAVVKVRNYAAAPSDTLAGSFTLAAPHFNLAGFSSFAGIAAGQDLANLSTTLQTAALGDFSETITLNPRSQNGSGYDGALPSVILTLHGVVALPPALKIKLSGSNVILSWPLAEQNWTLKRTTDVRGAAWSTVAQSIIDTAQEHTVTLARATEPGLFFRLEK